MIKPTFILSDESINDYGYRVITRGIKLDRFIRNPVMLYQHLRGHEGNNEPLLPIGRWENIRISGYQLLADANFDRDDQFANRIASKVEKGILNSASVFLNLIKLNDDPSLKVPGQELSTVVESELMEASIVDIPGNKNAVKLFSNVHKLTSKELALALHSSETEYERLWKSPGAPLEKLKANEPAKFLLLQSEFLGKLRSRKFS